MYLRMIFRILVMLVSGMVLVSVLERFINIPQVAWCIMGSVWAMLFMSWIASPTFDDRKKWKSVNEANLIRLCQNAFRRLHLWRFD